MSSVWREIRYAARGLARDPGPSFLAVVTLALGIGLTATMFSIVYGGLYRGLPFEDADRIVHLERTNPSAGIESMEVSIHDFVEWRRQQGAFEDLAAFYSGTVNFRGTEEAIRFDGGFMSANAFDVLGVDPILGRGFRAEDDRADAPLVMLLGYRVWQDRFGGEPDVVGRSATVNGESATIIGVMPEGFRFPILEDVWVPLRMDPLRIERGEGQTLEVFGLLREGVSMDRAAAEMSAIADRIAEAHPETNEGVGARIQPYTEEFIGEEPARMLWTMMAAVFAVLLVACVNVANLLLARASVRTRDVAIRSALGASRRRVVLHMLGEALVLATAGAVVGVGLAWVGTGLFWNAIVDTDPPFWIEVGLDAPVLLFVVASTVLAALVAGLVPAVKATSGNLTDYLKDESRGTSSLRIGRLSRGLVVVEVALSVGLLVGAALMTKSVVTLRTFEYPFEHEGVFTARLGLFESQYPDEASRRRFFEELQRRLEETPGARRVTLTNNLPGLGGWGTFVAVEGRAYASDQDYPETRYTVVSPGFFETFGVEVERGRVFTRQDDADSEPVAVVNRSFVERHFGAEDPVGRRIRRGRTDSEQPWRTVVGVVPDLMLEGVDDTDGEDGAGFYVPLAQDDLRFVSIAVRTAGPPMALTSSVRDAVASVDPDIPLYWVDTLMGRIQAATWFYRIFGGLFMVFGVVALFLAVVGVYGVMSFGVSRRTQEMGVRMALGARARDVLRLVVGQGLRQIAVGTVLGLGLALFLARGLQFVLFRVDAGDPAVFAGIVALLLVTGTLATLVPAHRATRVDPVRALRAE